MPRIVLLGTGTGVGKTYVAAALARALGAREPGARVVALKPIETGITTRRARGAPPTGSDAGVLERASRGPVHRPHPLYAYRDPVSPHLAARRARAPISLRALDAWLNQSESALRDTTCPAWLLIETAGGALSPVTVRTTNLDLAVRQGDAVWILVAPDALGVLHDVRATLTAMRTLAREPDYVVLSASRPRDASVGSNAKELARVGLPRPVAVLDRGGNPLRALAPLVRALTRRV